MLHHAPAWGSIGPQSIPIYNKTAVVRDLLFDTRCNEWESSQGKITTERKRVTFGYCWVALVLSHKVHSRLKNHVDGQLIVFFVVVHQRNIYMDRDHDAQDPHSSCPLSIYQCHAVPPFVKECDLRLLCSSLFFVAANFLFCDYHHRRSGYFATTLSLIFPLPRSGWDLSPNRGSVFYSHFYLSFPGIPFFPFPFFPPHGSAFALVHFTSCVPYIYPRSLTFFPSLFPFLCPPPSPFPTARRRSFDPIPPSSVF